MNDVERAKKGGKVEPLRPPRPCPECGQPSSRADYPFCSRRCRDIDLNRWLSGSYAIAVSEEESEEPGREDGGG